VVRSLTLPSLERGLSPLATPKTEACDAVGGALRPKWREWPAGGIRRVGGLALSIVCQRLAIGIDRRVWVLQSDGAGLHYGLTKGVVEMGATG
jgi:hypothetical protein